MKTQGKVKKGKEEYSSIHYLYPSELTYQLSKKNPDFCQRGSTANRPRQIEGAPVEALG